MVSLVVMALSSSRVVSGHPEGEWPRSRGPRTALVEGPACGRTRQSRGPRPRQRLVRGRGGKRRRCPTPGERTNTRQPMNHGVPKFSRRAWRRVRFANRCARFSSGAARRSRLPGLHRLGRGRPAGPYGFGNSDVRREICRVGWSHELGATLVRAQGHGGGSRWADCGVSAPSCSRSQDPSRMPRWH